MKDRRTNIFLLIIALVFIAFYLFTGLSFDSWQYSMSLRLPKLLALVLTSIAVAFSTMIFQTITNNRILTPSVMGFDTMYVLIQTLIVFVLGSTNMFITNKVLNFIMSTLLMMSSGIVFYQLVFRKSKDNILFLLLLGTVLSTFFRSITSFLQFLIGPNEFYVIQNQMFASFNNMNTDLVMIVLIALVLLVPFVVDDFKYYDVLALGRDYAINLGVPYSRLLKKSILLVTILISLSTALVGPITFLGLIVVNLARERLEGYHHSTLLVTSSQLSIIFLVGGQFLIERVFQFNTTISVIINFFGGIYFIFLLLKENRV